MGRIIESEFRDPHFHVAGQGQFLHDLHQFIFGGDGKDDPEFRVFERQSVVEDLAVVEQLIDRLPLLGDAADEFIGEFVGHGEVHHVLNRSVVHGLKVMNK